uniref:Uncharacterized protein n=1 Tax=Mesocestoides corti TaxID=53468 RepID=A0A5K3FHU7_MESCO
MKYHQENIQHTTHMPTFAKSNKHHQHRTTHSIPHLNTPRQRTSDASKRASSRITTNQPKPTTSHYCVAMRCASSPSVDSLSISQCDNFKSRISIHFSTAATTTTTDAAAAAAPTTTIFINKYTH